MMDRKTALRNLGVGDIFHARAPNGASLVCLVLSFGEDTVYARRIHTQDEVLFDKETGIERGLVPSKIDCVAPFPADIHAIFLAMDRRGQKILKMQRNGVEPSIELYRLTEAEHRANHFIDQHLASHPLED